MQPSERRCLSLAFACISLAINDCLAFVPTRYVSPFPQGCDKFYVNRRTSSSSALFDLPTVQSLQDLDVPLIMVSSPSEVQLIINNERREKDESLSAVVQLENKRKLNFPSEQKRDMRFITGVGIVFTVAFIFSLAMFGTASQNGQLKLFQGTVVTMAEDVNEIIDNVKEAVLPESATDVVSIMLGEGLAGAFGGAAEFITTAFVTSKILTTSASAVSSQSDSKYSTSDDDTESSSPSVSEAVTEAAVAGGDYFMTQAAAIPLLNALGLPPYAATFVSALVAAVPYEIIKLAYQRKVELDEEEVFMARILKEQQQSLWRVFSLVGQRKQVDPKQLEPATEEGIDYVDIFADVIKWLAYNVLQTIFGGTVSWYGGQVLVDPALESAFFGMVAGFLSQVYMDISYTVIGFGPLHKHNRARQKTVTEFLTTLGISCLSGAILFGVYQTVSNVISANNVSPCADHANDFDMCLGHYVTSSLTGTSTWDAKGRALVIAVESALLQLQNVLSP